MNEPQKRDHQFTIIIPEVASEESQDISHIIQLRINEEDHIGKLGQVIERLREANVKLKQKKMFFTKEWCEIISRIGEHGIEDSYPTRQT
ncbi:hypothetical protein JTB14_025402 [Gonioctena quinquepunctata]|nr:hypothetical protein JTB14_025402 [Gonioctena quinquepunctata]